MQTEYVLGVIGALIFAKGFFPMTNNNGISDNEPPSIIGTTILHKNEHYTSNITKTVLIVIDALRLDFAQHKFMPLTSKLTNTNGCFWKVSVETPTVTLPRIKALTTGSIPQFIDIVVNLANAQALQDTLIHSALRKNKKIVFYGDDTWLKLFPNTFTRFEGTNSFFVRDFKEVDDNVTRNVDLELQRDDWDILILHYLGLDHIGHVHGPFSPLIPKKLKEMDDIIKKIYDSLISRHENILLVVTSDHGMRDSGGHGGSTFGEVNVPLFMVGVKCQNDSVQQSDIPVNLAVLLGLDIPSGAVGRVHVDLFNFSLHKQLYVSRYLLTLLKKKTVNFDECFDDASDLHQKYLANNKESDALAALEVYQNCSREISNKLIRSSVQQDIFSLVIGILILLNVCLSLMSGIFIFGYHKSTLKKILLVCATVLHILQPSAFLIVVLFLVISLYLNIFTLKATNLKFHNKLLLILFLQPLTLISSSYVEEEHQFWYFITSLIILIQILHNVGHNYRVLSVNFFILSVYFRFIRRLNSTGDQWANHPDISDWLLSPQHHLYNILFLAFGLSLLHISITKIDTTNRKLSGYTNFVVLVLIFTFKLTEIIFLGQICWLLILAHFLLYQSKIVTWIFIAALLLKPHNIILIPFCIFCHLNLKKLAENTVMLILFHISVGNMLFYAQGHSNSLASVDVAVGYVGLYSYQPFVVILQVLLHTYAFPVLCHALMLVNEDSEKTRVWTVLFCYRFYSFFVVAVITFFMRHHLFIWSVFAPKLFIETVNVLFLFVEFCYFYALRTVHKYFHKQIFLHSF